MRQFEFFAGTLAAVLFAACGGSSAQSSDVDDISEGADDVTAPPESRTIDEDIVSPFGNVVETADGKAHLLLGAHFNDEAVRHANIPHDNFERVYARAEGFAPVELRYLGSFVAHEGAPLLDHYDGQIPLDNSEVVKAIREHGPKFTIVLRSGAILEYGPRVEVGGNGLPER